MFISENYLTVPYALNWTHFGKKSEKHPNLLSIGRLTHFHSPEGAYNFAPLKPGRRDCWALRVTISFTTLTLLCNNANIKWGYSFFVLFIAGSFYFGFLAVLEFFAGFVAFGLILSDFVTLGFFFLVAAVVFFGLVSVGFAFCMSGPIFIFDLFFYFYVLMYNLFQCTSVVN